MANKTEQSGEFELPTASLSDDKSNLIITIPSSTVARLMTESKTVWQFNDSFGLLCSDALIRLVDEICPETTTTEK